MSRTSRSDGNKNHLEPLEPRLLMSGTTDHFGGSATPADLLSTASAQWAAALRPNAQPSMAWLRELSGLEAMTLHDAVTDRSGNVYLAGITSTAGWTSGGFDTTFGGVYDGFVAKYASSGEHLWSTFVGGSEIDQITDLVLSSSGTLYVRGSSSSTGWISAGDDVTQGVPDTFILKLNTSGEQVWSRFTGVGSGNTSNIDIDANGDIYITGETHIGGWTSGGFDLTYGGFGDAFVAKYTSDGEHLWSTYLGGDDQDYGHDVHVAHDGSVFITGTTQSLHWADGFGGGHNGHIDAFLVKLTSDGGHLWSRYIGGDDADLGHEIAVDARGRVFVAGLTFSAGWTSGGFDVSYGDLEGFVAAFTRDGEAIWSTYLRAPSTLGRTEMAIDSSGGIYVVIETSAPNQASGGFDLTHNGGYDPFLVRLNAAGQHLWSSYLPGGSAQSLTADERGVYVTIVDGDVEYLARIDDAAPRNTGDFNNDGAPDLLWRDAKGNVAVSYLGSNRVLGSEELSLRRRPVWRIAGTSDFNSDGVADIVWRHARTGKSQVWFLGGVDGSERMSAAALPRPRGGAWQIRSVVDFNDDGRADILWRNINNGRNRIWLMGGEDGTVKIRGMRLPTWANGKWNIAGAGDFDADGRVDLLWRNASSGRNKIWHMGGVNGTRRTGASELSAGRSDHWQIARVADFDADGKCDIFWRNLSTGGGRFWFMNTPQGTQTMNMTAGLPPLKWRPA